MTSRNQLIYMFFLSSFLAMTFLQESVGVSKLIPYQASNLNWMIILTNSKVYYRKHYYWKSNNLLYLMERAQQTRKSWLHYRETLFTSLTCCNVVSRCKVAGMSAACNGCSLQWNFWKVIHTCALIFYCI